MALLITLAVVALVLAAGATAATLYLRAEWRRQRSRYLTWQADQELVAIRRAAVYRMLEAVRRRRTR